MEINKDVENVHLDKVSLNEIILAVIDEDTGCTHFIQTLIDQILIGEKCKNND